MKTSCVWLVCVYVWLVCKILPILFKMHQITFNVLKRCKFKYWYYWYIAQPYLLFPYVIFLLFLSTGDSYNSVMHSFNNKQIALNQLRSTLNNIESDTAQKQKDIENNNSQIQVLFQFSRLSSFLGLCCRPSSFNML